MSSIDPFWASTFFGSLLVSVSIGSSFIFGSGSAADEDVGVVELELLPHAIKKIAKSEMNNFFTSGLYQ